MSLHPNDHLMIHDPSLRQQAGVHVLDQDYREVMSFPQHGSTQPLPPHPQRGGTIRNAPLAYDNFGDPQKVTLHPIEELHPNPKCTGLRAEPKPLGNQACSGIQQGGYTSRPMRWYNPNSWWSF